MYLLCATGLLDLLSRTAQGAANQTRGSSTLVLQHRVRPPRMLYGEKKVVRDYLHAEAAAHGVLADFHAGKHRREQLLYCVDLVPRAHDLVADVAILTEKRLLLAVWTTKRVVRHIRLDSVEHFAPSTEADGTELLLAVRQEPWHVTVSDTQQQMRACMRLHKRRAQTGEQSTPWAAQRVLRLECGSRAECESLIDQLARALAHAKNRPPLRDHGGDRQWTLKGVRDHGGDSQHGSAY